VFNVGIGEIMVVVLVCLIVFGPERLPQVARQIGRFLGQLRLTTQGALDQLKQEADLKDVNLPDLRVGSLRAQARDYVRELLDIEGQMAELEREREQLKQSLKTETGATQAEVDAVQAEVAEAAAEVNAIQQTTETQATAAPAPGTNGQTNGQAAQSAPAAPVDPEAT
jgi:sec-independent protein translocase protein TatB